MAIASADAQGVPSVRMVLLKGYDERGFMFYSNYSSRKAQELANGHAALCMYWEPLQRQVSLPAFLACHPVSQLTISSCNKEILIIRSGRCVCICSRLSSPQNARRHDNHPELCTFD